MVTAKTTEIDKVRGLDMGADDYISKPFWRYGADLQSESITPPHRKGR